MDGSRRFGKGRGIEWSDAEWAHGDEPSWTEAAHREEGEVEDASSRDAASRAEPRARGTVDQRLVARCDTSGARPRWIVSCDGDAVSFSYWPPKLRTDAQGRTFEDPYNLDRYRGARTDLLGDEQLRGIGYSASEIAILKANALKESAGRFGAINTWDRQLVSWGMAQFAGFAGTLARVLRSIREHAPRAYEHRLARHGIDVAKGPYPHLDRKTGKLGHPTGWHVVVATPDGMLRGDEALWHLRSQPRLLGALMLAGNDVEIQLGQCRYWRDSFLRAAIDTEVPGHGRPISSYVTSEYGLGLFARLYNWMPAYVARWSKDFFAQLQERHPDVRVGDPGQWNEALETELLELLKERRRKEKSGNYDDYGPSLARARGSFVRGGSGSVEPASVAGPRSQGGPESAGEPESPAGPEAPPRPDVDVRALTPVGNRRRARPWSVITGITLHQTGIHGFGERAWPKVMAHVGVNRDGRVYWIHPLESRLPSSNGFNRDTVAIEVAGNFRRDERKPRSYWKNGGGPSTLTPEMVEGLHRAIRFIMAEVERQGGRITHVYAHRQANPNKASCPGAAIWKHGGVWAQEELGLSDGGPGYTRDRGLPIPSYWDERLPVPRGDGGVEEPDVDDFEPEVGAEHPDDEVPEVEAVAGLGEEAHAAEAGIRHRAVIVRAVPAGLREVVREVALARGRSRVPARDALVDELEGAGLELVETLELEADDAGAEAVKARGAAVPDEALELDVAVPPGETAAVLVEHEGVLSWVLPPAEDRRDEARARGRGARLVRFRLDAARLLPADRGAEGRSWRERVGSRLRAHVYALGAVAVERLAEAIDGRVREGLVHLTGETLDEWIDLEDLEGVTLPEGRPPRVLLLVHGTFSSTRGAFGALTAEAGRPLLRRMLSTYDLVLGYDHRTLTVAPQDNARALLERLMWDWPVLPRIDVVAHSRGGLVARSLVEQKLPAAGLGELVERMVLVAATNAGTELARPDNWQRLVDLMTTLAADGLRALRRLPGVEANAGIIGGPVVRGLGALVSAMATHALTEGHVPGLAAMVPGSALVKALNGVDALPWATAPRYHLVTSDFDAAGTSAAGGPMASSLPAQVLAWAADRVVRPILGGIDSDLVVDNASSRTLPARLVPADPQHFGDNLRVHHLNFFEQAQVHEVLASWLELGEAQERAPRWRERVAALDAARARARGPRKLTGRGGLESLIDFSPRGPGEDVSRSGARDLPSSAKGGPGETMELFVRGQAPKRVRPAAAFDVKVELSAEAFALEDAPEQVMEQASSSAGRDHELEVELVGTQNAEAFGFGPVRVRPPEPGRRVGLYFAARAGVEGSAEVAAHVRQDGRSLVRLALAIGVSRTLDEGDEVAEVTATQPRIELADVKADLQLEVIELQEPGGIRYRYVLSSEHDAERMREDSGLIKGDVADFMTKTYDRIEKAWQSAGGRTDAFERRLEGVGNTLAEQLLPAPIRAALWKRRKQVRSVALISDEAHVPWELLLLTPPKDDADASAERVFLGELGVVRSLWDSMPARKIQIARDRAYVVAPRYAASAWRLPSVEQERDFVVERLAAQPIAAKSSKLAELFEGPGAFDLLHYAGHGDLVDDDAALVLEVMNDAGPPSDVLTAGDVGPRARLRVKGGGAPLVFLNACKLGRGQELLSSMGGWAKVLLAHGAGAVVAPLWSVGDGTALRFAEGFYAELLAGSSFAEASRKARQHARKHGDPTWLAYVVYAQAGGTVEVKAKGGV